MAVRARGRCRDLRFPCRLSDEDDKTLPDAHGRERNVPTEFQRRGPVMDPASNMLKFKVNLALPEGFEPSYQP